jgi:hypothetical protein
MYDVILTLCSYTVKEATVPLLRPLDPAFPIERQLAIEASPVILVNLFTLDKADEQTFLAAWREDALFMKQQPGFISTHRPIIIVMRIALRIGYLHSSYVAYGVGR